MNKYQDKAQAAARKKSEFNQKPAAGERGTKYLPGEHRNELLGERMLDGRKVKVVAVGVTDAALQAVIDPAAAEFAGPLTVLHYVVL